ncbi:hypothetical protein MTsPCn5_39980 [Croceitalea sp. MTPC5]|nr:hypothetical protein MTsPCn5_39980 [Croceitalea sp. MTPC5]
MNLSGKWKGYYQYGFGYDLDFFGKKVAIEVEIVDDNGSISGNCKEEKSAISIDGKSEIRGFYEGDTISFLKTYPFSTSVNESHEIEYFGEFDDTKTKLFGKWTITEIDLQDLLEYKELGGEGIWFLEKETNL